MNRNDAQFVQSTRPASRRLHRRKVQSMDLSCARTAVVNTLDRVPEMRVSLPESLVREAGMFELLAADLRIAELEKALAEAQQAACTDPLTGALNRRGFDLVSQRELARLRRNQSGYALALIDLDDFKCLNDARGHQVGDRALVHLVSFLQRSMRPSDVLCRLGGEEFVLLLPETTLDAASTALSRLLREFSTHFVPGTDCVITFSAGVVAQAHDELLDDVIQRADLAAYAAKRSGKNCVISG